MIAMSDRPNRSNRLFGKKSSPVIQKARRTLEQNYLFRGRSQLIHIDESEGRLVLEGCLPSYHLKQMLQTVLRDVEGVEQIDNQVAVDYPMAE